MANSRTYTKAEDWIRREWMPVNFGLRFARERLRLSSGGEFDFDAVSADDRIAAVISCSSGITKSGRAAMPKVHKIRGDCLFLMLASLDRRILLFSDQEFFKLVDTEKKMGRLPQNIELYHVQLPDELEAELDIARQAAIDEAR
jgi:hypothetical protein